MIRRALPTLCALLAGACALLAAEYKGEFVSADLDAQTITVKVDDKTRDFKLAADLKVTAGKDKKDLPDGLKAKLFSKPGARVTLTTAGEGNDEVVKSLYAEFKQFPPRDK